jgi:hypothetical protein
LALSGSVSRIAEGEKTFGVTATVDRQQEESRDRAIRLFEYLKRLAELRTHTVRDLDEYTEVVWFAEVPSEPECRVATGVRPADPARWLTLERPRRVRPPELPEALVAWVDQRELEDSDGEPALRAEAELVAVYQGADGEVERLERHFLTDHPEVSVAWHRYRGRWERWAAEDRRLAPIYRLYKRLFDVEQLSNQLGEQFETVLGVGLLTWAGPSGVARKHLLTMPAELRFDAETGRIAVGRPEDGARLTVEEDMLEGGQLPSREVKRELDGRLATADPWDRVTVDALLRSWVHAADTRGSFDPSVVPQTSADGSPQVRFAPALILRRRSPRSLIDFYAKAIGQLRDEAISVPATIRDMVEILDDLDQPVAANELDPPEARAELDPPEATAQAPPSTPAELEPATTAAPPVGAEVYFPLPSNDEQVRIVERLARHRGVIVQGPPGTGKSHSIANLISHLAALGKRVLVTSHTGRALEVLKGKLPPDIAQLCVSMVGDGRRGTGDLDRSVQALVARATDRTGTSRPSTSAWGGCGSGSPRSPRSGASCSPSSARSASARSRTRHRPSAATTASSLRSRGVCGTKRSATAGSPSGRPRGRRRRWTTRRPVSCSTCCGACAARWPPGPAW